MKNCAILLSMSVLLLLNLQATADSLCTLYGDPHLTRWDDPNGSEWERPPGLTKLAQFCGHAVQVQTAACSYGGLAVACTTTTTVAGACNYDQHIAIKGDAIVYEDVSTGVPPISFTPTAPFKPNACVTVTRNGPGDYSFALPQGNVHVTSWSIPAYLGGPAGPYENIAVLVNDSTCILSGACGSSPGSGLLGAVRLTPEEHWDSWKVSNFCDSIFPWETKSAFSTAWTQNKSIVYPTSPITTTDAALNAKATAACAALKAPSALVAQCAGTINAAAFWQACMDDVLLSGLVNFAADSINAFALQCATRSVVPIVFPTSGAYSTAAGAGLGTNIPIYATIQFTIYSRDIKGNLITTGGDLYVVTSSGPSALTFNVNDNGDGTYTVTYSVNVAGTYTLEVRLNGVDSIRGSAFVVTWVTNACVNLLVDGLAATLGDVAPYTLRLTPLTVNNPNQQWKWVNGYIVSCNSAKSTYVFDISNQSIANNSPVGAWTQKTTGVINNQKWTYNTTTRNYVSNSAVGFYLKHVTSGSVHSLVCSYDVPPAVVVIQPALLVATTSASKSVASGPGLGLNVPYGAQSFTIYARDTLGNPRTTGGDIFSVTSSPTLAFTITDNRDGTYRVSYTAAIGNYNIQVKFGGSQISGSPYTVSYITLATDAAHTIAYGPGLASIVTSGIRLSFKIQARTVIGTNVTVGGDVFAVTYTPAITFPVPAPPVDNFDGSYTVTYEQDDVLRFAINIKYKGVDIAGSPFAIQSIF